MLERDSARRSGTRASNLRLAWYGAAAAFAGILAGGVAWLAYDNHKSAGQMQAVHDAHLAAVPPMLSGAGAPARPDVSMLPVPSAEVPRPAVIVDESPAAARPAATVPPLVMLPPEEGGTKRGSPAPTPAPRVARSGALPPLVMPPQGAAARGASRPAPRPAREAAASKTSAKAGTTASAAAARPRSAQAAAGAGGRKANKVEKAPAQPARSAKAAPQRSAVKTAADTARQRKAGPAASQVDSDVALISAIIAQSERHRGEREAPAACGGAKCPAGMAQP